MLTCSSIFYFDFDSNIDSEIDIDTETPALIIKFKSLNELISPEAPEIN